MLQVLVAVNEDFIVHLQLVDEVFYEEEVISVERRQLYSLKVFSCGLSSRFRKVDKLFFFFLRNFLRQFVSLARRFNNDGFSRRNTAWTLNEASVAALPI